MMINDEYEKLNEEYTTKDLPELNNLLTVYISKLSVAWNIIFTQARDDEQFNAAKQSRKKIIEVMRHLKFIIHTVEKYGVWKSTNTINKEEGGKKK